MSERRARVKVKKATTRAEACAEFERKKARLRRRHLKRRVLMLGGCAALGYVAIGFAWAVHTGELQQSLVRTEQSFWDMTAAMGFRVDQVVINGRRHAPIADIKTALATEQGTPILAAPLAEMKARLETIPEVKSVAISRELPNELRVVITERAPVAWWQKDGMQQLVDAEGVVLARQKPSTKESLPVVVGPDAAAHVSELIALFATTPSLKPDVVAAVRVGSRRWNVQMQNGMTVMLPEDNPQSAWQRFAKLVEKEALFSKAIRSVDMRLEDRVFIMPIEQQKSPITLTTARDT